MRHNNHHQNNNNKNRNNTVAQNQSIVLLDIPYIVIRSLTRFKLAILTAASGWVTDFFMVSTSAWYCLVSEFVALTTLAIFSVVGKAHCDPTDRPTCSTAPFHLDFGTADCYVMRLRSHVTPISSQYPPRVKRPNSRQAIVKSRRFVILLKKTAKKKKITLAMKIAASLFHSWKFSTSGSCAYRVFCRSLQAKLKYNFNWVKLKPFWLWTPPHFQKTLWFSLDETHHNCKYHVKNISKVTVIQCNLN